VRGGALPGVNSGEDDSGQRQDREPRGGEVADVERDGLSAQRAVAS
jgi:hypothetical protein